MKVMQSCDFILTVLRYLFCMVHQGNATANHNKREQDDVTLLFIEIKKKKKLKSFPMTTTVNAYFPPTQNKEIYNNYKLQWMLASIPQHLKSMGRKLKI